MRRPLRLPAPGQQRTIVNRAGQIAEAGAKALGQQHTAESSVTTKGVNTSGRDTIMNRLRNFALVSAILFAWASFARADQVTQYQDEVTRAYARHDMKAAFEWLLKCAKLRNADCEFRIAQHYENGAGVNQDAAAAIKWYQAAAEQDHAWAQGNLANLFYDRRDFERARYWYEKCAAHNWPQGFYGLATLYEFGLGGLPRDVRKALSLYQQAVAAGDVKDNGARRAIDQIRHGVERFPDQQSHLQDLENRAQCIVVEVCISPVECDRRRCVSVDGVTCADWMSLGAVISIPGCGP